jgi:hypothetical protein
MRLVLILCLLPLPALADAEWTAEKCSRYARAWDQLAETPDLSPAFTDAQNAFIARGCQPPRDVCPSSADDLETADLLSLMAVAEGMAGSFLPFACD